MKRRRVGEFPGCVPAELPSPLTPLAEHLGLLACVNQTKKKKKKRRSGEGKVEERNSYLSSARLPKKKKKERQDGAERRAVSGREQIERAPSSPYPKIEATGERPP